jgi:ribosomal protein S27E
MCDNCGIFEAMENRALCDTCGDIFGVPTGG